MMGRVKEFNEIEALDKATELFWTKGYNATSANDLVQFLGLSRSSLYATFGDKRRLFVRAIDHYRARNVKAVVKMIETSDDLLETIREIFVRSVSQDFLRKTPKGCLMGNTAIELVPHDEEIAQMVQANEQDLLHAFEAAIRKGQELDQLTNRHTASALANFLYNNLTGLRVSSRARMEKQALKDVVELCLSALRK